MPLLVSELARLLSLHGVDWRRVLLSASDDARAGALSAALRRAGLDGSRVVADTVSFAPWVAAGAYDGGVDKASSGCRN